MTLIRLLIISMFFGVGLCADSNEIGNRNDPCETDRDCADSDYCTRNGICLPCFSCEGSFQERGRKRCAKGPHDCGDCLPGYAHSSYVGPNRKRICSPVIIAEPMTAEDRSQFIYPVVLICISIMILVAINAFVRWQCYRKRPAPVHDSWNDIEMGPRAHCADGASLPPPSYEDAQRCDNGSVAYSFQLRVTERPEKLTTAIPFQLPLGENIVTLAQPSQENSSVANNEVSSVPENESETDYPTPVNVHDESTQPSTWTPGPDYLVAEDETDGASKEQKNSPPPNKRRKTDQEEKTKNDPDC